MFKKILLAATFLFLPLFLEGQESIERIEVEGNVWVPRETVLYYLSAKEGNFFDKGLLKENFKALWSTGFSPASKSKRYKPKRKHLFWAKMVNIRNRYLEELEKSKEVSEMARRKKKETKPEISPRERWEKISKLAHEFFVARGRRHGHGFEDWLKAEKIVDSQYTVKKISLAEM